jgi:secondary thiamine-phosphate synthase enzyme
MQWFQREISLRARARGFHLITDEVVGAIPEVAHIRVGVVHVFILHTSASLCINENADPSVRSDLEAHFNQLAPEHAPHYLHTVEGPDDMPAHIKSALIGTSVTIPVTDGNLKLGRWQGVYLCEHRDHGGPRRVVVTLAGEER